MTGCSLVVLVYIYCDSRDTVFQIEREECNIPISIGRLLAAWLAAQVFSQAVRVSASYSEGRGFNPPLLQLSSFTLSELLFSHYEIYFSNIPN